MVSRQSGLRSDLPQFALPKGLLEAAEIRSDEDFNEVPDHGGTITKAEVKIVVRANDEGSLPRLLDDIKRTAAPGHSFAVVVDEETEGKGKGRPYGFDGDGSFRIHKITVRKTKPKKGKK